MDSTAQQSRVPPAPPTRHNGLAAQHALWWVSVPPCAPAHSSPGPPRTRHKRFAAQHSCGEEAAHHPRVDQQQRLARLVGADQVGQLAQRAHCRGKKEKLRMA